MTAYHVRIFPHRAPTVVLIEHAPSSVAALIRALQRVYPGDACPASFLAHVSRSSALPRRECACGEDGSGECAARPAAGPPVE